MAKVRMVEETKVENKIYAPPVVKTQSPAEIARLLKEDSPPKVEPTVEPPLVQPAPLTGRYLVLEAKIVSFNGHITFLPKDTLVDDSSYGPGAIEKLLAAGVKLEKQA